MPFCFTTPTGRILNHEKIIGRGSQGVAHLVRDKKGFFFVVKEINICCLESKETAINELETMRVSCQHENIVKYFDSWFNKTSLMIVMEFAINGSMDKIIKRHQTSKKYFCQSQIVNYLTQLCEALKHCHGNSIIHRDVKPANILVYQLGNVKLTDFGLSKNLKYSNEMCKTYIGTPLYMSPEILTGEIYSYASDIWSCGCVMYELMEFKTPWYSKNGKIPANMSCLENIIMTKEPEYTNGRYSNNLLLTIKWMLQKNQNKRPSAADIIDQVDIKKPPTPREETNVSNSYVEMFDKNYKFMTKKYLNPNLEYYSSEYSELQNISSKQSLKVKNYNTKSETCKERNTHTNEKQREECVIQNPFSSCMSLRNDKVEKDFKLNKDSNLLVYRIKTERELIPINTYKRTKSTTNPYSHKLIVAPRLEKLKVPRNIVK